LFLILIHVQMVYRLIKKFPGFVTTFDRISASSPSPAK